MYIVYAKDQKILWKESLNSDCQQFSTKLTIISPLHSLNKKKTMTYDIGNSGLVLGQEKKCGSDKSVNGIPTLLFLMYEYQVI